MFAMKLDLVIILIFFQVSNCSRRIQDGQLLTPGTDKSYVVYIVRAPLATKQYDHWMCGGALVTSVFVVTSAACIDDVNYLFVIAGYDTYVNDSNIEKDPCTSAKKKKVIFTCCPAEYDVKYDQLERWSLIDIGVVKVESPYDFNDESFKTLCSYIPTTIPINYESKYQEKGTDALVFGWGHLYEWRKESDKTNYNQQILNYAPVLIMDKQKCKKHYEVYNNMSEVIDKYMICSFEKGNINDQGIQIIRTTPPTPLFLNCRGEDSCDEEDVSYADFYNSRKNIRESNNTYNESVTENVNKSVVSKKQDIDKKPLQTSRRYGICQDYGPSQLSSVDYDSLLRKESGGGYQNDHGGPLVTYVGTHEVLIGIASVFKVAEDSSCTGPFLYTSTQCNGAFLNCVLTYTEWPNEKNQTRRSMCKKKPRDVGHATIQRHISWADHPAGPADDERHPNIPTKHKSGAPPYNEHYAEKRWYTTRERNIGRQPGYEEYAATSKYVPNENNKAHGKHANVMDTAYSNNAANGMDTAYGKHGANVMDTAYSNHGANVMDTAYSNNAANGMDMAYGNHGANLMNTAHGEHGANVMGAIHGNHASNNRLPANERYIATEQVPQIDNDRLIMRPQRPLHS